MKIASKLPVAACICLLMNAFALSRTPDWLSKIQKLKVAESTRRDVEYIFGSPKISQIRNGKSVQIINYELGYGNLQITYSTGKCSQHNDIRGVDVEAGVVVEIYLFLFRDVKISKLNLDLSKFIKYKSYDSNAVTYTDEANGIGYTGGDKIIRSVRYEMGDKFDYLDCRNVLK